MKKTFLPNAFVQRGALFTKNLTPGKKFFDEFVFKEGKDEYRKLDPRHSKLAAAFMNRCKEFGFSRGCSVLYLGASHGYTPSFVSDMIGADGQLFCVEFSPTVCRDLVFVCEQRENMAPILADANRPEEYAEVPPVDVVFQDIAQKNQVEIFLKNVDTFGKAGAYGLLALKAKSVDAMIPSRRVFKRVRKELQDAKGIRLVGETPLQPYEKDHAMFVVKKT